MTATPATVLLAHNFYQYAGGEDEVFDAEGRLLAERGHEVIRYTRHNDDIRGMSRARVARSTVWNRATYHEVRDLVRERGVEVAHFHNTFPLISPSAYYGARDGGATVVQTLHNFRIGCVNAAFFRDGRICEDCLGKPVAWRGVVRACYRGSRAESAGVAAMAAFHRARGTWAHAVDAYIALSDSSRRTVVRMGVPEHKVTVKPNFVLPAPEPGPGDGGFALYVGRLSAEKGIATLLAAWQQPLGCPLRIAGTGPLSDEVRAAAERNPSITYLGRQPREAVFRLMGEASVLVLPSIVHENFPMTVAEGFACGLPVIVSGHGAMAELVEDGVTGRHFRPGSAEDLAAVVRWCADNPGPLSAMRARARREFLTKYTAEVNYERLIGIYRRARNGGRSAPSARR